MAFVWPGSKIDKILKLAKLPKSVQSASLLGSNVRDNAIDVIDDNHDDTNDGGANVDADSTWY